MQLLQMYGCKTLADCSGKTPVLLKGSYLPKASHAGRKPEDLAKAHLLFWQRFKRYCEITARMFSYVYTA